MKMKEIGQTGEGASKILLCRSTTGYHKSATPTVKNQTDEPVKTVHQKLLLP